MKRPGRITIVSAAGIVTAHFAFGEANAAIENKENEVPEPMKALFVVTSASDTGSTTFDTTADEEIATFDLRRPFSTPRDE